MRAAQAQGVKRYVQLSAAYALDQAKWPDLDEAGLEDYYVAKYYSDRWLIDHPGLDYTIIQAGTLTTAPATGQVALNAPQVADNSIADVAAVLVATLDHPNTIGKVIMMQNGTTPIDPALAAVTTSAPVD